jgi:hypothetical protein
MNVRRLDHRLSRAATALLLVLLGACEDDSVTPGTRTITMVQPLTMDWSFKNEGAPYSGGTATFQAEASLRVAWRFRIEGHPVPPDGRNPRYVQSFPSQESILFSWHGHSNTGTDDFAFGDSCVATVSFPRLDPAEEERARYIFVIGR